MHQPEGRSPFRLGLRELLVGVAAIAVAVAVSLAVYRHYHGKMLKRVNYKITAKVETQWHDWILANNKMEDHPKHLRRLGVIQPDEDSSIGGGYDVRGVFVAIPTSGETYFRIDATHTNYQQKAELVKKSIDEFVERNPDLKMGKARIEIHSQESYGADRRQVDSYEYKPNVVAKASIDDRIGTRKEEKSGGR